MNRLRSHKFKLNNAPADIPETNNNNDNSANASGLLNNSLLNKLSKRYSTLSSKITRRTQAGRRGTSPQKIISGSYDMTGSLSEDHRLEIGAPVLISSTTLDAERFDVSEERLKMIGGGVAATNNSKIRTIDIPLSGVKSRLELQQPQVMHSSSGSENEIFVDALSSTPQVGNGEDQPDKDVFEMALETPRALTKREDTSIVSPPFETPQKFPEREEINGSPVSTKSTDSDSTPVNQMANYYESSKHTQASRPKSILTQKPHSQSAHNLHRSEIKVYLQKAPSVNLNEEERQSMGMEMDLENISLPKLPELFGHSKCDLAATTDNEDIDLEADDDEEHDADKENSSPSVVAASTKSKSEPNTPFFVEPKRNSFLTQKKLFQSAENIHQRRVKRRSVVFSSSTSINQRNSGTSCIGSKNSLSSQHSINFEDYDLKSVSCQSLNPQTLFVSIDELNDLTRQINESEEFNQDIDLEYCVHRDALKPSERRITLLKNKNTRLISFNHNKQKIKKGWTGMKHWIGEEGSKIRDVVQRQPLVQRIGSSKLNLSNAESRNSPSLNGSVLLKHTAASRGTSQENNLDESGRDSKMTSSMHLYDSQVLSSDNIADSSNELTESFEQDNSGATKKAELEGQNGFEELRRYVKQGGDFGKELIVILQERIDSELMYSKSLSKMANKLNKACRELPGTIADAWRGVATEMETRSDIHRQLSASLAEEVVKPLKSIVEGHHKTRKSVESNVDKASRVLAEWRVSEAKGKKSSHTAARENEKLQDAMLDVRIQKSPSIALLHQSVNKQAAEKEIKLAEKDCAKLDNKRKKAEEAVKKADVEYYTLCVRAERARVDWEMAVLRGSSLLQNIENQRLINMKNFVSTYLSLMANMNPIMESLVQRLQPQVENCNVVKDMQIVKNIRRNAEGPSEQLLPDFYCEHTTLAMNRERRKHALVKLLQLVKTDLERERRSRNGLKGLSQSLNSQEHQNITDKLYHIRSMLTYLEGARFKLHSALLELDHKPRSSHPLAQHIQITRDRTGLQQSILKVPLWLKNNDKLNTSQSSDETGNEYDTISQGNTTTSTTNISCLDSNISSTHGGSTDGSNYGMKSFNRSKSNIETFSNKTKICVSNGAAASLAVNGKTKTLSGTTANLYDDTCSDDRGQADGGSNQQDSDFDEFSSQDEDEEGQLTSSTTVAVSSGRKEHKANIEKSLSAENYYQNSSEFKKQYANGMIDNQAADGLNISNESSTPVVLGRCKALYNYTPKLYDELELIPGDIIEVHAKQDDGWWLGALRNQVGIFPATYVEEIA
ncbi:nostrin isoform X1 [Haematobia irritans]|uniref:nostrin isoform X1 n=1 Tax=Haematobia irritans TaxID=7368 RepID=UPI003F50B82F